MAYGSQPQAALAEGGGGGRLGTAWSGAGNAGTPDAPSGEAGAAPNAESGGQPAAGTADGGSDSGASSGGAAAGAAAVSLGGDATGGAPCNETSGGNGNAGADSSGSAGTTAAGGSNAGGPPVGDPARGRQLIALSNCYRCHGDNLAGRGFYRNITPDIETGIGSWTDKQIADAVRGAIGPTGELFCASMPLYSGFKDQDIADVISFLRIIPAVTNPITAVCPGHNP